MGLETLGADVAMVNWYWKHCECVYAASKGFVVVTQKIYVFDWQFAKNIPFIIAPLKPIIKSPMLRIPLNDTWFVDRNCIVLFGLAKTGSIVFCVESHQDGGRVRVLFWTSSAKLEMKFCNKAET